jgi:hypothetical protein
MTPYKPNPLDLSSDYAYYIAGKGNELLSTFKKLFTKAKSVPPDQSSKFYERLQDASANGDLGDIILHYSKTITLDDLLAIDDVFEEYNQAFHELAYPDSFPDFERAWKQYASDVVLARTDRQLGQTMHEQGVAEDWQKVNRHDKTDGLSKKAVSAYRREHPGSKLKTAVTTKPSKLKKGSKSAKRRASFCARMSGMKKHRTGAKTKRDPDSNINKALRRWHCESIEEMQELIMIGEQYISKLKEDGSAGGTSSGSIASVSMPLGGKKKKKGGGVNLLGGPVFKR